MSKKRKQKKQSDLFSTDRVAIMLHGNMLRDFRASEGSCFFTGAHRDLTTSITTFRNRKAPEHGCASLEIKGRSSLRCGNITALGRDVGRYKRVHQMNNLLKKYRFSTDIFTDDELSDRTFNKFLDEQIRLHQPLPLKTSGFKVLQRARLIARRILGEFPGDEIIEHVQFGKKSSIGCPLSLAYIDEKLSTQEAFTGTLATTDFFMSQVLPGDHILQRILANHNFVELKDQLNFQHLNLVEVPKTWKSYRLITPLTLLGLFYSYGIGRVVTSRLQDAGLSISRLQEVHRSLVKGYSVTRSHATADLSWASDSITSEALNRVLPRAWYNAVKKTFVRRLDKDGSMISTASVLPMGNGATFPVETLFFYCIIKAIGDLSKTDGTFSVYGDDLIYPSAIHKYVTAIFPQLHLKLNLDKTFVSYPFRESCGSDYYRGQDVRPYFLKGGAQYLTRVRYEAFLYKVYNGLTARWEPDEIRSTLTWLLSELAIVTHAILRVPPSFPDYSGIKVSQCQELPLDYTFLTYSPTYVQFSSGSRWFQFEFLTETPRKRVVKTVEPYYWLALQGVTDEIVREYGTAKAARMKLRTKYADNMMKVLAPTAVSGKSSLRWTKVQRKPVTYYNRGRKVVKKRTTYTPVVAARLAATVSTGQVVG